MMTFLLKDKERILLYSLNLFPYDNKHSLNDPINAVINTSCSSLGVAAMLLDVDVLLVNQSWHHFSLL